MNIYIKIVLGTFGTILIGALGSGLWERLLAPIIDYIYILIFKVLSFFINTYKDSIYLEASDGFHEEYSIIVHSILLMTLPLLYFRTLLKHPELNKNLYNKNEEVSESKIGNFIISKKGFYTLIFITISLFVAILISTARVSYINSITTYSLKSIEILSPYLTEKEVKKLRSEFYSIKNASDFYLFRNKLLGKSKLYNIQLPTAIIDF